YANARVFIDKIYPTSESRTQMRQNVAKIASSILIGFRSMLDQLDWMTAASKKGAYSKIDNLVKNIAYPDWITNDTQLTAYHKVIGRGTAEMLKKIFFSQNLGIEVNKDSYTTMVLKAQAFAAYTMWDALVAGPVNRVDFLGPPGTTNAWYQVRNAGTVCDTQTNYRNNGFDK
ncbi:hypothetical protein TELCIR_08573, partial [Teladorsagia circumcincta]